jgi:hypothetical protein
MKKGASGAPFVLAAGLPATLMAEMALGSGGRVRISLDAFAVMVLYFGLVLQNLPVQLVDHRIDRCIEVFGKALDMYYVSPQAQIHFRSLSSILLREFFDTDDDSDIDDVIEMAFDAFHFRLHIFADGRCQLNMMPTDCEIHTALLWIVSLAVRNVPA